MRSELRVAISTDIQPQNLGDYNLRRYEAVFPILRPLFNVSKEANVLYPSHLFFPFLFFPMVHCFLPKCITDESEAGRSM